MDQWLQRTAPRITCFLLRGIEESQDRGSKIDRGTDAVEGMDEVVEGMHVRQGYLFAPTSVPTRRRLEAIIEKRSSLLREENLELEGTASLLEKVAEKPDPSAPHYYEDVEGEASRLWS